MLCFSLKNGVPKAILIIMPLLLLSFSFFSQALSVSTAKTIQGTAPYLTFDGGVTKATNMADLLWIELSDGKRYMASNTSSATAPIELLSTSETLADVKMLVPITSSLIPLTPEIINSNYWDDDDGDGKSLNGVTITPDSLTLTITDKNNQIVNRTDTLDNCNGAPYRMVLSIPDGTLATQYGSPNSSTFTASTATYYIKPAGATVCFVKPDMTYAINAYAGPVSMWNTTSGFIPQSIASSTYDSNFPTTGSNGLYFDLAIKGASSALSWNTVTVGGITATPDLATITATSVRYTLTGPVADTTQIESNTPGLVAAPSLPAKFELIGTGKGITVNYGFVLKKWFINRGAVGATAGTQASWCASAGYRIAKVNDLTNASGSVTVDGIAYSIPGALPASTANNYQRVINGGFASEWGNLRKYSGANFDNYNYWTSDVAGANQFLVSVAMGPVLSVQANGTLYAMCVRP